MARMMKETKEKIEKMLNMARKGYNGWLGTDMPISIATAKRYPNIFIVTHEYEGCYEYDEAYDEDEDTSGLFGRPPGKKGLGMSMVTNNNITVDDYSIRD